MTCPFCKSTEVYVLEETFKKENLTLILITLIILTSIFQLLSGVSSIFIENDLFYYLSIINPILIIFLILTFIVSIIKALLGYRTPTSQTKIVCILCRKKWYLDK